MKPRKDNGAVTEVRFCRKKRKRALRWICKEPILVLIPANEFFFYFIRLPSGGRDRTADVESGASAGELAGADDDHVAAGRVLNAECSHHHLGVELQELEGVLGWG